MVGVLRAFRPILGILARGYPLQPVQMRTRHLGFPQVLDMSVLPHLTPLYGLMTSRYRRGYACTPNTERVGLDDLDFY